MVGAERHSWGRGGDCLKSQIFLSENRKSVSGLVSGYGVFQSREDFSDSLGGGMQKGLAKTLANPLQERKRQDSNLRTALGRSTVFEAASFSHSDTLPVILLGLCPKLSQSPRPPPFSRGRSGPAGFPSPLCLPCPPAPARHLMTYLNPPNPLFKGAHQAFVRTRARGHRFAVLRPASEDALVP